MRLSDALAQVGCLCTCEQPQGDTQTLLGQRFIYACQCADDAVCIFVCMHQCNMMCALYGIQWLQYKHYEVGANNARKAEKMATKLASVQWTF